MATFRVGQRVRIIGPDVRPEFRMAEAIYISHTPMPNDTVPVDCQIEVPGHINPRGNCIYNARRGCLTPLTDPNADAFMERLKKLGREPLIVPDKVTV